MDQLALTFTSPGIRHNQPPEAIDAQAFNARLLATDVDLVARFCNLQLACGRMPEPIASEEDPATATDFIAQCQLQVKQAEAAQKQEKSLFLSGGRAVDTFFKTRSERLSAALASTVAPLKANRDEVAAAERHRHSEARERATEEARSSLAEAEAHRARAKRPCEGEQSFEERRDAIETLRLADNAAERAEAARRMASALEPMHIRGNDGATAFVRRSWRFEVIDRDHVPREYMTLDVAVVREAITHDGIRHIPGLRIFQTEGLRVRAITSPRSQKTPSGGAQAIKTSKSAGATSSDQRRGPRPPTGKGRIRSSPDPGPVVSIKSIWGDQKVLRYYRQALASLQPHDPLEIAKFRAANAAIEARLRRKLPQRMEEIDCLYGGSRVLPEAGEGTPK
jgi:hypothetical protein